MKQQEVFKKIGVIIQEINEQYEYLQSSVNNLNDLELELFVANTHFLKDHAEILRKLNAIKSQPVAKTSIKDEPKWFEPMVQPAKPTPAPFKADTPKPVNNDSIKFEIVPPAEEEELKFEKPEAIEEPEVESPQSEESFSVEEEPETIRHELVLDEADNFEDEEEGKSQDEELLTPVAEIEEEPEVESSQSEEEESPEPEVEEEPIAEEEVAEPEPVIEEEPVAEEPAPEIEEVPEPVAETEPEPEPEPEVTPEPVIEEEGKEKEEEPAPLTLFDAPQVKGKKALAESMEDIQLESFKPKEETKEAEPVLTLNQRLSAQKKDTKPAAAAEPAEHIEPLSDIKTAITLNDKLLFVKDLFKGYNLAYTEAIEIVNRFSNFEEADRFLKNNYVTKNNWEGKKETSEKFYALLRRRYA